MASFRSWSDSTLQRGFAASAAVTGWSLAGPPSSSQRSLETRAPRCEPRRPRRGGPTDFCSDPLAVSYVLPYFETSMSAFPFVRAGRSGATGQPADDRGEFRRVHGLGHVDVEAGEHRLPAVLRAREGGQRRD